MACWTSQKTFQSKQYITSNGDFADKIIFTNTHVHVYTFVPKLHFILHEIYIQLRKRDADLFGSDDLPIPPSCLFTVWADSTCNPEKPLRHPVLLYGIDSDTRKIYINRFLETTGILFCYYHKASNNTLTYTLVHTGFLASKGNIHYYHLCWWLAVPFVILYV